MSNGALTFIVLGIAAGTMLGAVTNLLWHAYRQGFWPFGRHDNLSGRPRAYQVEVKHPMGQIERLIVDPANEQSLRAFLARAEAAEDMDVIGIVRGKKDEQPAGIA